MRSPAVLGNVDWLWCIESFLPQGSSQLAGPAVIFAHTGTDGVRVTFEDGWGLVRSSNTQPILVLRFEATSEEALARIQDMVMKDLSRVMKENGA